ncbi:MAG: nucleotidyltransferase domain-containing protein [Candidatus Hodarchaeales archaeon]
MPREKVIRFLEREFHEYSRQEEQLLRAYRKKALKILLLLEKHSLNAFVHGSVARGDVKTTSDIDIHIPMVFPSYKLEILKDLKIGERRIIMGTPNSTIKGLIEVSDLITISFPLTLPTEREFEFFRFSGKVTSVDLRENKRVPGVSKKLLLIEPDENGYWVSSVTNSVQRVVSALGISQRIVEERLRVLSRRDQIGRTGILINQILNPDESFEQKLKLLADRNPIVRRKYKN